MNKKQTEVIMIDSLIGNDYTFSLAMNLVQEEIGLELIVPENREFGIFPPFEVKRWSPAKNNTYGKMKKAFKYVHYLYRLFVYSKNNKNKIVHFQFFRRRGDILLFYIMSLFGIKLVFTAHNIMPHEKNILDKFLQNLVYRSAGAIIVHSEYIKKKLLMNFRINEKKIHVIPHGNFDIYLQESGISRSEARKKLGLSQDDKVLLFFGYIREYKGLDLLLDAFANAGTSDDNLKLVIAGRPMNEALRAKYLSKIAGISANGKIVTRLDFIPSGEIQDYFEASDIVILPYKNIDHSGIVHLAYSFHKPVIVSQVGDFPETIEHGKSGFVLNENTPARLSEQILEAVGDMKKLLKMGEYAGHLNDTKYSWINISRKTAEVYRSF